MGPEERLETRLRGGSEGSVYLQCRAEVHPGDRAETELENDSPTASLQRGWGRDEAPGSMGRGQKKQQGG